MCNSQTNASLKIQNLVPKSVKSAPNIFDYSVTVNKIVYVVQRDKFVTVILST